MHHRTRNVQEVGYKLQPNFSAFSERSVDAPPERGKPERRKKGKQSTKARTVEMEGLRGSCKAREKQKHSL